METFRRVMLPSVVVILVIEVVMKFGRLKQRCIPVTATALRRLALTSVRVRPLWHRW